MLLDKTVIFFALIIYIVSVIACDTFSSIELDKLKNKHTNIRQSLLSLDRYKFVPFWNTILSFFYAINVGK